MINLFKSKKLFSYFVLAFILVYFFYDCKIKESNAAYSSTRGQDQNETPIQNGHYAVISIDLDTNLDFYLFYLPITCLSWRLINFEPIILAIISDTTFSNKLVLKTLEYLIYFKFKVVYLKSVPELKLFCIKIIFMVKKLLIS